MTQARDPGPLTLAAPTVLVVDDERNIRRTLEMVLTGEGYRVLEADRAETALDLLGHPAQPVDVAIVDLQLPGMSGLEALQGLKSDAATRDGPVMGVRGHATVRDGATASTP